MKWSHKLGISKREFGIATPVAPQNTEEQIAKKKYEQKAEKSFQKRMTSQRKLRKKLRVQYMETLKKEIKEEKASNSHRPDQPRYVKWKEALFPSLAPVTPDSVTL